MIGRGVFGNPWVFNPETRYDLPRWRERLRVMLEHTQLFDQFYGNGRNFEIMKKFYKAYSSDFPDAKELRLRLMDCHQPSEVYAVTYEFLARHGVHDLLPELPALAGAGTLAHTVSPAAEETP